MLSKFTFSSFFEQSLGQIIEEYFLNSETMIDLDNLKSNLKVQLNSAQNIITYQTVICLFLGKKYQLNNNYLAKHLTDIYSKTYPDIKVNISGNHWLELQIGDRLLMNWLKKLVLIKWQYFPEPQGNFRKNKLSFNDYYIPARFASILKSAHQQKLITINNLDFAVNNWWIQSNKNIFEDIVFSYPSYEYNLMSELLLTTERIYQQQSKVNYVKFLAKLAVRMSQFERYCRIWGKVKEENLSLSQVRLNLMAIALHYYQSLFYRQFQQQLPTKL